MYYLDGAPGEFHKLGLRVSLTCGTKAQGKRLLCDRPRFVTMGIKTAAQMRPTSTFGRTNMTPSAFGAVISMSLAGSVAVRALIRRPVIAQPAPPGPDPHQIPLRSSTMEAK